MNKLFFKISGFLLIIFLGLIFFTNLTFAKKQDPVKKNKLEAVTEVEKDTGATVENIKIEIVGLSNIAFNQDFILKAEAEGLPKEEISYHWDFGDGGIKNGKQFKEVEYSYKKPGKYEVVLNVSSGEKIFTAKYNIFSYENNILLLSDIVSEKEKILNLTELAKEKNIYLHLVESFDANSRFLSEENLVNKMKDNLEELKHAKALIVWTSSSVGLNALTRLLLSPEASQIDFTKKHAIYITEGAITTLARIAQEGVLGKKRFGQIIITRKESLRPLLEISDSVNFLKELENRLIEFKIVDTESSRLSWNNFLLYFVNYMRSAGISSEILILILMIPIITCLIAFVKQVIGISTFGVYLPTIVTLFFLTIGLKFGLPILFLILLSGFLTRFALKKVRMLYTPRMAIVLSISSITIFFILAGGIYFELFDAEFVKIAIFPLLVMSTLAERFVNLQSDEGYKSAFIAMSEMLSVSLVGYFLVGKWIYFQDLLLAYPEIILLFIFLNILLGRWTGLRLVEYFRFREIFGHAEE